VQNEHASSLTVSLEAKLGLGIMGGGSTAICLTGSGACLVSGGGFGSAGVEPSSLFMTFTFEMVTDGDFSFTFNSALKHSRFLCSIHTSSVGQYFIHMSHAYLRLILKINFYLSFYVKTKKIGLDDEKIFFSVMKRGSFLDFTLKN